MNSESSKTSQPYRILFDLTDKTDLKGSDKYVALSNVLHMEKYKKVIPKQ